MRIWEAIQVITKGVEIGAVVSMAIYLWTSTQVYIGT